jgi:uncharacterized protein (DUF433 family)
VALKFQPNPRRILKEVKNMTERIVVDSRIHFGKPCIAGTRIPVQNVLELLAEGFSFEQIIQDYYPDIDHEDIRACLRYATAIVAAEEIHLTEASG